MVAGTMKKKRGKRGNRIPKANSAVRRLAGGDRWGTIFPTVEEMLPMWEEYEKDHQNQRLRNRIAEHYIPAVRYFVGSRFGSDPIYGNVIDDLFTEAAVAMMTAVERFRHTDGNQFWTFAQVRVQGACYDYLRTLSDLTRTQLERTKSIEKFREDWRVAEGTYPTDDVVSKCLGVDLEEIEWLRNWERPGYLSAMVKNGQSECRNVDLAMLVHDPVDHTESVEIDDFVKLACRGMTDVEQAIIVENLFQETSTLKVIGQKFALSESRVSQIKSNLIPRLRDLFTKRRDEIPTCLVKG